MQDLKREVGKVIVGQEALLEKMLVALLADGHILIEGVPGLAKTLAVKTLAQAIHAQFQRIQFTPDLLPADITGTLIFNPKDGLFYPKRGPVFSNFVLADEINRSPAKVQSALLEAMQERQVTIGEQTYKLPAPFMVLATQNPVEQEGTYPLPEAQVDRFMLKVMVTYPTKEEEKLILERMSSHQTITVNTNVTPEMILKARQVTDSIYVDEKSKLHCRFSLCHARPQIGQVRKTSLFYCLWRQPPRNYLPHASGQSLCILKRARLCYARRY